MFLPSNITLKFGDSGDFVSELQRRLVAVSCFSAEAINGFYDGSTVNGVSQFQSMSGIRADGIAGPETLRRLNGVISGDNSSTDNHKAEEEARAQQENLMRQQIAQQQIYEQQQALLAQQQAYAAQVQAQATAEVYAAQPQPQAQQQPQAYQQNTTPEMAYAQAPVYQAPQQAYQPPAPNAGDDVLARMLLGQQPPQQQQQPLQQQQQPPQQVQQPPLQTYAAVPPAPAPITLPTAIPAQPAFVPPQPAPPTPVAALLPETNTSLAPTAEPQRGMLGRAAQFVSEKMQQLSNYFESKLPNHVLNEVKNIGVIMAQSGVKEASIPTGPEPQRGIEGPQRGQQQGQQRS